MEAGRLFAGISGGRWMHEVSKCFGAGLPGLEIDRLLFWRLLLDDGECCHLIALSSGAFLKFKIARGTRMTLKEFTAIV